MRVLMTGELNGGRRQRKGFLPDGNLGGSEVDLFVQLQHALTDVGDDRHDYRSDAGRDHGVFDRRRAARVLQETG
jgi:hypothetical protein